MIVRIRLFILLAVVSVYAALVSAQNHKEDWETYLTVNGDVGLLTVYEAGLLTPLDEIQERDGLTIRILWGYVDAARVSVGLQVDLPETMIQPDAPSHADQSYNNSVIRDTLIADEFGNAYPLMWAGATAVASRGSVEANKTSSFHIISYQVLSAHTPDEMIPFTLVGSVDVTPVNDEEIITSVPFTFEFVLPYHGGYTLADSDIVLEPITSSDIEVTLTRFKATPSVVELEYCMEIPFALGGYDYSWNLAMTLTLTNDDEVIEPIPQGGGGGGGGGGDPEPVTIVQCSGLTFFMPQTASLAGEWSFTSEELQGYKQGPMPDDLQAKLLAGTPYEDLKPELIESGYEISVAGEWGFTFQFEDQDPAR